MRKLGEIQQCVLRSLREHGSWNTRSGWIWNTQSGTQRIMESLVRRGVAKKVKRDGRDTYVPVEMDNE